ncbi:hypothetical protein [Micromonospora sp. NPDC049240]|uniref:hypothetical protein n=1 Tax=Micromonospora sp. NPDC049240 TaxID=3155151 RepID=UPI0033FD8AED
MVDPVGRDPHHGRAGRLTIRTAGPTVAPHTWDDLVGHFEFGVTAGQRYRLGFDGFANRLRP